MKYSTDPLNLHPHPLNAAVYGADDLPGEFLDSIRKFGILTPLVVLEDGTVISGHRRRLAALQLGYASVPIRVVQIKHELDIAIAVIEGNRQREKTFSVKMREAEVLHKIALAQALDRRLATLKQGQDSPVKDTCPDRGQTRDAVADQVGIGSGRTYDRARSVWASAQSGNQTAVVLVQQIDAGETTIGAAYRELRVSAAEVPPPAKIAPGGWGVNPEEDTLHWWEKDPTLKTFWLALVSVSTLASEISLLDKTPAQREAVATLMRDAVVALEQQV